MPSNYVLLNKQTLTASAASVTFSSIPQTGYTDLKVVISARSDRNFTNDSLGLKPNNSTSNRSGRILQGSGAAASSTTTTGEIVYAALTGNTSTANVFSNIEIYCPNYTSSNFKSFSADGVMENNTALSDLSINAWLWSDVSPITSLVFYPIVGSNFIANSEFCLYGLAAVGTTPAIAPFATGGDSVTTDGTYWIHTFLSSGTFTPAKTLSCDYLVVAGGGGGGAQDGGGYGAQGGGGAGGLRSTVTATGGGGSLESAISVTAQAYTVTIGGGGAGSTAASAKGSNGSNSVFSTITSTGGGGGGSGTSGDGANGGSGGGGGWDGVGTQAGGTGTANQGYAGGSQNADTSEAGAGGGGAGATGTSKTTGINGGAGGAGVSTSISGSSISYAGGGGGGAYISGSGGSATFGGGGGGANGAAGAAGTVNRGGGGGGAGGSSNADGGAGGSGIVIVRYPIA
jgi:hypothetical protein